MSIGVQKKTLQATEYLSEDALKKIQLDRLKSLVVHSIKTVPFYKKHYSHLAVHSEAFEDSFRKLPLLDKDDIKTNRKAFISKSLRLGIRKNTGGSTGAPFVFYLDRFVSRQREKAFIFDQWRRVGYKPGDLIFNLRGALPADGSFVKRDYIFNTHSASSLDLSPSTIHKYVEYLKQNQTRFFTWIPFNNVPAGIANFGLK